MSTTFKCFWFSSSVWKGWEAPSTSFISCVLLLLLWYSNHQTILEESRACKHKEKCAHKWRQRNWSWFIAVLKAFVQRNPADCGDNKIALSPRNLVRINPPTSSSLCPPAWPPQNPCFPNKKLFSFYTWKSNGLAQHYTDTSAVRQEEAYATAHKIKRHYCRFTLGYPRFRRQSTRTPPVPHCPAMFLFDLPHPVPSPQLEWWYWPGLCFAEGWFLPPFPPPSKMSEKGMRSTLAARVVSWESEWGKIWV